MPRDLTLHMGFVNTPYTSETIMRPATSAKAEAKRKRKRGFSKTMTAQKVANILEGKYNIVETFSEIHEEEIHNIMHDGFKEIAKNMIEKRGGSSNASLKNLMKPSTDHIQSMFRQFLDSEEMNGMVPGVPTGAALLGIRHGRGSKTKKGQRPSFVDTGIYKASFRAWVK
jgi:hypothetical protein